MKAWMGFTNRMYCKSDVLDDVLLRVWEYDPAAFIGNPFKPGVETITLSKGLPAHVQASIRNRMHDLNGTHAPTAAEILADTPPPRNGKAPVEHHRGGVPKTPQIGAAAPRCMALVVYVPLPVAIVLAA